MTTTFPTFSTTVERITATLVRQGIELSFCFDLDDEGIVWPRVDGFPGADGQIAYGGYEVERYSATETLDVDWIRAYAADTFGDCTDIRL